MHSFVFFCALMITSLFTRSFFIRKLQISRIQFLLLSASINVIFALTLRWWSWIGTPPMFWLVNTNSWRNAFVIDANWIFNCLLFMPASYLLTKFIKKPIFSILIFILVSFGIETLQGIFEWGASDPADWVANSTGTIVGVLLTQLFRDRKSVA